MNIMKKWNSTTTIACLTRISSHTGDVFCFPGWYGYTLTPFLHKRNRTLIAIIILQYHRLFKIAQFSHCFPEKKNQQLEFLLSCWFLMWTSQGLNLGPPDYESVALTNWATSPVQWIFFLAAAKLDKNSDTAKCVLLKIWLNMDNCLILHGKSEGF